MHNALYIDELVRYIVHHCEDQTSDLERRRTLFRLGSTSKLFLDAALDSLWSRLPSMTPLLKLIPGVSVLDGVYTVEHGMISSLNTQTFERYARRAREISQLTCCRIDAKLLESLPCFMDKTGLICLPNLSTAHLSFSAVHDTTCYLPISSSMQHLRLRVDTPFKPTAKGEDILYHYLTTVQAVAPHLHSIVLRGKLCQRSNEAIATMSSLKSISFRTGHSLSPSTFTAIAGFPSLRSLTVRADHLSLIDISPAEGINNTHIFPALEELNIHAQDSVISHILSHIRQASLISLCIEFVPDASSSTSRHPAWDVIFRSIASISSPYLHTLRIETHTLHLDQIDPAVESDHLNFFLLNLLAPFTHLSELSLLLGMPVALTDMEFATLVPAWPALQRLRLDTPAPFVEGEYGWSWRTPATPRCLSTIAAAMPMLKELELAIDVSTRALLAACTDTSVAQSDVCFLHLTSGPECMEPKALAKHLHALFPALEDVQFDERHHEAWRAVEDALGVIRNGSN